MKSFAAFVILAVAASGASAEYTHPIERVTLPYELDALEPAISERTVDLHYNKHHKAYADNFKAAMNKLVDEFKVNDDIATKKPVEIIAMLKEISDATRTDRDPKDEYSPIATTIRNNGGGLFNHNLYFDTMKASDNIPTATNQPDPESDVGKAIAATFTSFDLFKEVFTTHAKNVFGSGWVFVSVKKGDTGVELTTTRNQDTPLMEKNVPFIAFDVWEHAYYLDRQNVRADYITAWWDIVDWTKVNTHYQAARTEAKKNSSTTTVLATSVMIACGLASIVAVFF